MATTPSQLDVCMEGYYCEQGSWSPTPGGEVNLGRIVGNLCPPGSYCPEESITPTDCPRGTFSNAIGNVAVEDCEQCVAGKYCYDAGLTEPTGWCPPGRYCPLGTADPVPCPLGHYCAGGNENGEPCPTGSFQNETGASMCQSCPPGYYCDFGSIDPTVCILGHYCLQNTTHSTEFPCPAGTYNDELGASLLSDCKACRPGEYCSVPGLPAPEDLCDAGHYCLGGSSHAAPTDGFDKGYVCSIGNVNTSRLPEFGDFCPPGHYCPMGSTNPEPCPPGTFFSHWGASNESNCEPCTAGYKCPEYATVVPVELCDAGYYCPAGTSQSEFLCPEGHYCVEGTVDPQPCAAGSYQNRTGSSACLMCPAGFYCPTETVHPALCPEGRYCGSGSETGYENACPPGTYSNRGGLALESECDDCPSGSYCESFGLTQPEGDCSAGFYCALGSSTSNASPCPPGYYCPQGAPVPLACPSGTYRNTPGATAVEECFDCLASYQCPSTNLTTVEAPCSEGYFCPTGTGTPTEECPEGHFCIVGRATPQACRAGTYQPDRGQASCHPCPAGAICSEGTFDPAPCPVGKYCPGSNAPGFEEDCPPGTFNNGTGLTSDSECTPCLPGFYCPTEGTVYPTLPCGRGHYCSRGASVSQPTDATGGKCSAGYVCEAGAAEPVPDADSGYSCPPGNFCPIGAIEPVPCPPGTFTMDYGRTECDACPIGRSCPGGTVDPEPCPENRYCSGGSAYGTLCPPGTYSEEENLDSPEQCAFCPRGKYCLNGNVTADCSAGYVCHWGNAAPTPENDEQVEQPRGEACPRGHYCPEGVLYPIPCPDATFRADFYGRSVSDCLPCPAGYQCFPGNPVPMPCDPGFYCELDSAPVACPVGTYNEASGSDSPDDCKPCPPGYVCDATGIADLYLYVCPAGFWCEGGDEPQRPCPAASYRYAVGGRSRYECLGCPGGYICPDEAEVVPALCANGTYCPMNSTSAITCPAGAYCPAGTETPIQCPGRHFCPLASHSPQQCPEYTYCPPGTGFPLTCPRGYYARPDHSEGGSRLTFDAACSACPRGTYTDEDGLLGCSTCQPGYLCLGATSSASPLTVAEDGGTPCPAGHYCPPGSYLPLACPKGTYQPNLRAANITACLPCPEDTFSGKEGAALCQPCSSSSTAEPGSTTCDCAIGSNRIFQGSDRQCVCRPGYEARNEDFQVISDSDGTAPCQPIVLENCATGLYRAANGACVSPAAYCEEQCEEGGTFLETLGVCSCNGLMDLDTECNAECRETLPQLYIDGETKHLVYRSFNGTDWTTYIFTDLPGLSGSINCDPTLRGVTDFMDGNKQDSDTAVFDCEIQSVELNEQGLSGVLGVSEIIEEVLAISDRRLVADMIADWNRDSEYMKQEDTLAQLAEQSLLYRDTVHSSASDVFDMLNVDLEDGAAGGFGSTEEHLRSRQLFASSRANALIRGPGGSMPPSALPKRYHNAVLVEPPRSFTASDFERLHQRRLQSSTPRVNSPVFCLRVGDGVLFTYTGSDRNFPQYVPNSLLNTNPNFDYGAFRDEGLRASTISDRTGFTFLFDTAGTYVFASSSDPESQMILRVVPAGTQCPLDTGLTTLNSGSMIVLGTRLQEELYVEPDWLMVGIILSTLILTLVGAVAVLVYMQKSRWEHQQVSQTRGGAYKKKGTKLKLGNLQNKGGGKTLTETFEEREEQPPGTSLFQLSNKKGVEGLRPAMPVASNAIVPETNISAAPKVKPQEMDLDRWEADDIDLRVMLERLTHHSDEVSSAFNVTAQGQQNILVALRQETERLRRMLMRSAVETAVAEEVSGSHGGIEARRGVMLRMAITEMTMRTRYDNKVSGIEHTIMGIVSLLRSLAQPTVEGVSSQIVSQLQHKEVFLNYPADGTSGDGTTSDPANMSATAIVKKLYSQLSALHSQLSLLSQSVADEKRRREVSMPLVSVVAELQAISSRPGLLNKVHELAAMEAEVDASIDTLFSSLGALPNKTAEYASNVLFLTKVYSDLLISQSNQYKAARAKGEVCHLQRCVHCQRCSPFFVVASFLVLPSLMPPEFRSNKGCHQPDEVHQSNLQGRFRSFVEWHSRGPECDSRPNECVLE